MLSHYILPSLDAMVGHEELQFLKMLKIEYWDLVLCALDYYAKGQDLMYAAYWTSFNYAIEEEYQNPEWYDYAKYIKDNIVAIRARADNIYNYIRNTLCVMLHNLGISSQQFSAITQVTPGCNYFVVEIKNGTV